MKTRRFDHIDLRVKDMVVAQKFYGQLLPALGFSVVSGDDEWRTHPCPGEGLKEFFGLTKGTDHRPNENRIDLGGIPRRSGPADRDCLPGRGLEAGRAGGVAGILAGYCAVFFEDPSGNKLEICFRESRPA